MFSLGYIVYNCLSISLYIYTQIDVYVCIYIYIYVYTSAQHVYTYIHTYVYIYIYICIFTHMYLIIYTHLWYDIPCSGPEPARPGAPRGSSVASWRRNMISALVSCDIYTHTPAKKSSTNFRLYPFLLQTYYTNRVGHGHGYECHSPISQCISTSSCWYGTIVL